MNKHEWKPGDKCLVEAEVLDAKDPAAVIEVRGYEIIADKRFLHRIHKLGEQRPKTLADVPAGEVWKDGRGTLWVRTDENCVLTIEPNGTWIVDNSDSGRECAHVVHIFSDWTRIGPIEGVKIGGKMYGEQCNE